MRCSSVKSLTYARISLSKVKSQVLFQVNFVNYLVKRATALLYYYQQTKMNVNGSMKEFGDLLPNFWEKMQQKNFLPHPRVFMGHYIFDTEI